MWLQTKIEKLFPPDMWSQIEIGKLSAPDMWLQTKIGKNFPADMWSQTVPIFFLSYIGRGYAVQLLQRLVKW